MRRREEGQWEEAKVWVAIEASCCKRGKVSTRAGKAEKERRRKERTHFSRQDNIRVIVPHHHTLKHPSSPSVLTQIRCRIPSSSSTSY
jgi:hypothetical protein